MLISLDLEVDVEDHLPRSRWKMADKRVIQFSYRYIPYNRLCSFFGWRRCGGGTNFEVQQCGGGGGGNSRSFWLELCFIFKEKNVLFSACRHRKLNVRRDEPQTNTRPPKNICFWLRKGSSDYLFKRLLELRQAVLKINEKEKCSGYLERFLYLYFQDNIKISQILSDKHHRLQLYQ